MYIQEKTEKSLMPLLRQCDNPIGFLSHKYILPTLDIGFTLQREVRSSPHSTTSCLFSLPCLCTFHICMVSCPTNRVNAIHAWAVPDPSERRMTVMVLQALMAKPK